MPAKSAPFRGPILLHVWSIARELLTRKIDMLDVPALAAQAGFQGVEWLDRLMPSFEPAFWEKLASAQEKAGLEASAFSLSLELTASPQSIAAQKDRAQAIIGLCPRLGVQALRVGIGGGARLSMARLMALTQAGAGEPGPLNALGRSLYKLMLSLPRPVKRAGARADAMALQSAAWSLQPLARQAAGLGILLGVENHFGLTSHAEDLLTLLDLIAGEENSQGLHENQDAGWAARSPLSPLAGGGVGACLDTGNYPQGVDPGKAAALLAPRAVHVHWKLKSIPPADEERRVLAMHAEYLKAAGYGGAFSVEYEGKVGCLAGAKAGLELLRELY